VREANSVVRRFARKFPTNRDTPDIPAAAPHDSAPSTYSSAFVGGMYSEVSPSISYTTDPVFQNVSIQVRKQRAGVKVSWDLAADAASLFDFLAEDGGRNLALVEDDQFINGDGTLPNISDILDGGPTQASIGVPTIAGCKRWSSRCPRNTARMRFGS
jgi:HK97 family phage major capsid protein